MVETPATAQQSHKQEKVGEVTSTKMKKTIVVQVTRRSSHALYQRVVSKTKKFYAHDEKETARLGDIVRIVESRPLSRLKRWRLAEIVRRPAVAGVAGLPGDELAIPGAAADKGADKKQEARP